MDYTNIGFGSSGKVVKHEEYLSVEIGALEAAAYKDMNELSFMGKKWKPLDFTMLIRQRDKKPIGILTMVRLK